MNAESRHKKATEEIWKDLENHLKKHGLMPSDYDKEKHCLSFNKDSDCIVMEEYSKMNRHPLHQILGDLFN